MNNSKWTLILNPMSGGGKGKKDRRLIEKLLISNGFHYELLITEYPKHAIILTKQAIERGANKIIVAGGDGTLNEVVNGIFQQQYCLPETIIVGIIPVGTGNDWIKTFGIPNNYQHAIEKLKEQKTLLQDVGQLFFANEGFEDVRYFSNMAGFGFDALVTFKANQMKKKGRSGLLVYLISLISALSQYKTPKVKISIDGIQLEDLIFSVSIGIGKFNGGGMMQAPNAVPNNGVFEVTLIKKIGIWGILSNLVGLYTGTYIKDKRVISNRAEEVYISSKNKISGEVDGESLGKSNFHIKNLPQKLNVIIGEIVK